MSARPVRWLVCVVLVGVCLSSAAQMAVVLSESRQGGIGYGNYREVSGNWRDSIGKSAAVGLTPNIGSRAADIGTSPDGARARWTLAPPADGVYDVEVTWPTSGNAFNVTYRVTSGGQTQATTRTQDGYGFVGNRNSNRWVTLGTFDGGPANPIVVEVTDETVSGQPDPNSPGRVYADAVRLMPAADPSARGMREEPTAPSIVAPPPPAPVVSTEPTVPAPEFTEPLEVTPPPPPVAEAPASGGISWGDSLEGANQIASGRGHLILLTFATSVSRNARLMETDTWSDASVIEAVNEGFVPVRIEMESNQSLCTEMRIYRSPTTIVLRPGPSGPEEITRIVGYASPSDLLSQLSSAQP